MENFRWMISLIIPTLITFIQIKAELTFEKTEIVPLTSTSTDTTDLNCIFSSDEKYGYKCLINNEIWNTNQIFTIHADHNKTFRTDLNVDCVVLKSKFTEIPQEIFLKFQNLKFVNIRSAGVAVIHPKSLEKATHLTSIWCNDNKLTELQDETFFGASNLENIFLNNNEIEFLGDEAFSGLSKLKSLDLGFNKIKTLKPTVFAALKSLETIDLSNNTIEVLLKDTFAKNLNLTKISLNSNKIKAISSDLFDGLTKLLTLNLKGNICIKKEFQYNLVFVTNELNLCFTKYHTLIDHEEMRNKSELIENVLNSRIDVLKRDNFELSKDNLKLHYYIYVFSGLFLCLSVIGGLILWKLIKKFRDLPKETQETSLGMNKFVSQPINVDKRNDINDDNIYTNLA